MTGPAGSAVTSAAATDRPWDRMIVRNAQLAVQVDSVEEAIGAVRNIARAGGGFVSASNTKIDKVRIGDAERERASANLTVQVRVDLFDAAIQSMRKLGKVESENGTSQDVTEEYVDLDSNLRSLRATENAVMTMLEKAQTLPDVLTLQRELAGVRTQIERIEGRKRFLSNRSEFSTIAVTLSPSPLAVTPGPTATPAPTATPTPVAAVEPAHLGPGRLAGLAADRARDRRPGGPDDRVLLVADPVPRAGRLRAGAARAAGRHAAPAGRRRPSRSPTRPRPSAEPQQLERLGVLDAGGGAGLLAAGQDALADLLHALAGLRRWAASDSMRCSTVSVTSSQWSAWSVQKR